MFTTPPEAEHTLMGKMFLIKHWTHVELMLAEPIYYASFWHREEDYQIGRTLLLSNHLLLIDLSHQVGQALKGVDISLPSHYTGKDHWTTQPLRAIWRGESADGTICLVYETRTGERYSKHESIKHEQDLHNPELIFSFVPTNAQAEEQPEE